MADSAAEETRALAERTLADFHDELRKAQESVSAACAAVARAACHLDQHHELLALATRIENPDEIHARWDVGSDLGTTVGVIPR